MSGAINPKADAAGLARTKIKDRNPGRSDSLRGGLLALMLRQQKLRTVAFYNYWKSGPGNCF